MNEAKIPVLVFKDANSGEPDEVYFMDEKNEGNRFFKNLQSNSELNDRHSFVLEMWTREQCDRAKKIGLLHSGDLTGEEADKVRASL